MVQKREVVNFPDICSYAQCVLCCSDYLQAHSSCQFMLPKECGFGYLHKLLLPPYAVSMPNVTLWSSCSESRCKSATSRGKEEGARKLFYIWVSQ